MARPTATRRSAVLALAALVGGATGRGRAEEIHRGAAADAIKAPPASESAPVARPADLAAVLAAVRQPGASAVLVNVWATWCDPCREEMPEILRFYRQHRAGGLRLVLVSADDPDSGREVADFLAKLGASGARAFIKTGDDMAFINGLDPRWSGALPASFLFDGRGQERHFWPGRVTYRDLDGGLAEVAGRGSDATKKNTKGHP